MLEFGALDPSERQGDRQSQQIPDVHFPQIVFLHRCIWLIGQSSSGLVWLLSKVVAAQVVVKAIVAQSSTVSLVGLVGFDVDLISRLGQSFTFTLLTCSLTQALILSWLRLCLVRTFCHVAVPLRHGSIYGYLFHLSCEL